MYIWYLNMAEQNCVATRAAQCVVGEGADAVNVKKVVIQAILDNLKASAKSIGSVCRILH